MADEAVYTTGSYATAYAIKAEYLKKAVAQAIGEGL